MSGVRPKSGGLPEVQTVPDLFPDDGESGLDSRGQEGELVRLMNEEVHDVE